MTKVFYFIFILFFIGTVSAGEFSISPPQVNFEGELKQEICGNFFISTPEKSILIGEDRWGEKEETRRKFSAHTLSSEELGLEIKYPELIESEVNGLLFNDLPELTACIKKYCLHKEKFDSFRQNAHRTIVNNFSISMIAQQYNFLYKEIENR